MSEEFKNQTFNAKVAWVAMIAGLFIYFAVSCLRYQVPPITIDLQNALGLSLTEIGWLSSILGIVSLILAVPAGYIVMSLGVRRAIALTGAIGLVGTLIGGFATDFTLLMVGRVFQGTAMGLDAVISFQVVAAFFPPEKRGLPNSFVSASYVFAYFLMMNIAVPLVNATGEPHWQNLWYFCDGVCLLAIILAYVCVPKKADEPFSGNAEGEKVPRGATLKVWTHPWVWLPAITFILFNIGYFGIATYYPTFLVEKVGADQAVANLVVSLNALVGVPGAVVAGIAMNKLSVPKRKYFPAFTMVFLALCYLVAFSIPNLMLAIVLMLLVGFTCCFVPPSLYTIGPDIIKAPSLTAIAIAVVTLGQNLGMSIGPVALGAIVDMTGDWTALGIPTCIMALVGALACFLIKIKPIGLDESATEELVEE